MCALLKTAEHIIKRDSLFIYFLTYLLMDQCLRLQN